MALELEPDATDLDRLPAHAERLRLSAAQARELAADPERHASRVESAQDGERED